MRTEAVRACARYGARFAARAEGGLDGVLLLPLDERVADRAARLEPLPLRSLDAIHLASALSLDDDLGVLITYDARLAEAAQRYGVAVVGPA